MFFSRWNERGRNAVHKWGIKKIHERVNNDEQRCNARAREKSLLERREKQS